MTIQNGTLFQKALTAITGFSPGSFNLLDITMQKALKLFSKLFKSWLFLYKQNFLTCAQQIKTTEIVRRKADETITSTER